MYNNLFLLSKFHYRNNLYCKYWNNNGYRFNRLWFVNFRFQINIWLKQLRFWKVNMNLKLFTSLYKIVVHGFLFIAKSVYELCINRILGFFKHDCIPIYEYSCNLRISKTLHCGNFITTFKVNNFFEIYASFSQTLMRRSENGYIKVSMGQNESLSVCLSLVVVITRSVCTSLTTVVF